MMTEGWFPRFDSVQIDETWISGTAKNRQSHHSDPGKPPVIAVVENDAGAAHTFLFNGRGCHVTRRMADAAAAMQGRRLTWAELTTAGPSAN